MYLVSKSRTNFNNHAKFITIGNIMNSKHNKATLRQRLKNFLDCSTENNLLTRTESRGE